VVAVAGHSLAGAALDPAEPAHPDPGEDPDTVESAMSSVSAISAPVIRSRLSVGDHLDPSLIYI
jgi:hypothetical protein